MKPISKAITIDSPEINFKEEAVVALNIGMKRNKFVNLGNNNEASDIASRFSLLKYGHLDSVKFFAFKIYTEACRSNSFRKFLEKARTENRTTFITSPGIYNTPSASNILLKETVTLINSWCSISHLPPVKILEQSKLEESQPDYSQRNLTGRMVSNHSANIMPEIFKDGCVIYIDDVYITGTVAKNAKERLYSESKANSVFFLFGIKIDPTVVEKTDGKVEEILNRYQIKGSLESLRSILIDDFQPTQKTLRDLLIDTNRKDLPDFLDSLLPNIILKLYLASTNNGFRERWNGIYKESLNIIEKKLMELKFIDESRKITSKYL